MDLEIRRQFRMGQASEIFALHLGQVFRLFSGIQMLQGAASAATIQRALGLDTVRASLHHFKYAPAGKILFLESQKNLAEFARQGSSHKADATISQAAHTFATLHHLVDAKFYES